MSTHILLYPGDLLFTLLVHWTAKVIISGEMCLILFQRHFELYEGIDAKLVFQLAHPGQHPVTFHTDSEHLANRYTCVLLIIC
jgi:hypothetical protein